MRFLPSCRQVQADLTEYLEGALPLRRRFGIWLHLLFCRVCSAFLRGLKALPNLAKTSLAPPEHAPDAATQALAQVQATLRKTKKTE